MSRHGERDGLLPVLTTIKYRGSARPEGPETRSGEKESCRLRLFSLLETLHPKARVLNRFCAKTACFLRLRSLPRRRGSAVRPSTRRCTAAVWMIPRGSGEMLPANWIG